MVDIHTHILFGIDDGAKTLAESIEMARAWVAQGTSAVVSTPHYDNKKGNKDDFFNRRDTNIQILKNELQAQNIQLKVLKGAELYYRTSLIYED